MDKTSSFYLTGYTIPNDSEIVGEIKSHHGTVLTSELAGKDAGSFSIGNDHVLRVNKNKLKSGVSRFDIVLKVRTSAGEMSETVVIVKDDFLKNKVVAHRGAWKNTNVPENSIAAFNHAVRLGCEGSEFDVHMSADSLPVVNHDASIQGISIARSQSAELLKLRLSNGEPMPTLEGYLKAGMNQHKTKLVLEIKPSELGKESSIALTQKIVQMVEALHAQAWTDYISFDYDVCKEVMKLAPYARVAYLNGDKSPEELAADKFFGFDYNIKVVEKNSGWVPDAHQRKLTVNVWTVNDREKMEWLLNQNVDFITTNEPELLLSLVKK